MPRSQGVGKVQVGLTSTCASRSPKNQLQHLTTTDPNARLPDNNTGHGPQHDLRNPCGDEQSSSMHSEATRRLSSSSPGEQQEKKTSSYNSMSSAADNSKGKPIKSSAPSTLNPNNVLRLWFCCVSSEVQGQHPR